MSFQADQASYRMGSSQSDGTEWRCSVTRPDHERVHEETVVEDEDQLEHVGVEEEVELQADRL